MELPAAGYPISEDAVTHWYEQTYQRLPTDGEMGAILSAMAQRDATSPRIGPAPDRGDNRPGPAATGAFRTGASPIGGRQVT
jgi:hypothetical protein